MVRLLVGIWLLVTAVFVNAEVTYQLLENRTDSPLKLDGEFTQEKYLAALQTSLSSHGDFNYRRSELIRWNTLYPIENELVMTPESIVNKQGDEEFIRLESSSNPVVSVFSEIFFAVLTADWSKLSTYFRLSGEMGTEGWVAVLVPIEGNVGQVVTKVELQGDRLPQKVVMHEPNGNRTTIKFRNMQQ